MGVFIEYGVDHLAYKVVRTRPGSDGIEYLSSQGWTPKDKMKSLEFDETMLWEGEDLAELATKLAELHIKPREASFIEGKLSATERHLQDMRLIVGHSQKIPQLQGDCRS